jgi:hypothetical protein
MSKTLKQAEPDDEKRNEGDWRNGIDRVDDRLEHPCEDDRPPDENAKRDRDQQGQPEPEAELDQRLAERSKETREPLRIEKAAQHLRGRR